VAALGDDDEPVAGKLRQWHLVDREVATAHRTHGSPRAGQLGLQAHGLPTDEETGRPEQREGQLDELGEPGDGPGGDCRPAPAMVGIAGQGLGALGDDRHPSSQTDAGHGGLEEARLLGHRLDEQGALQGHPDGEWQPRKATPTAEVQERVDACRSEDRYRGQAVGDVADRDGRGLADRGQVDGFGPGQQEADVVVDEPAGGGVEIEPEAGEGRCEGGVIRGRKRGELLDARRERFSLATQAPLLGSCRPPVRATPVVVRRTTGPVGLPWLVRFMAGSPRAPREPRYPPLGVWYGCRRLRLPVGRVNAVIHESTDGWRSCG
jgi:hypothetical protein